MAVIDRHDELRITIIYLYRSNRIRNTSIFFQYTCIIFPIDWINLGNTALSTSQYTSPTATINDLKDECDTIILQLTTASLVTYTSLHNNIELILLIKQDNQFSRRSTKTARMQKQHRHFSTFLEY